MPTPALRNVSTKDALPFEVGKEGEPASKPDTLNLSEHPGKLPGEALNIEEEVLAKGPPTQKFEKRQGCKNSKMLRALENVPQITIFTTPSKLRRRRSRGEPHVITEAQHIYVNCLYPAAGRMAAELEVLLAGTADADLLREAITNAARRSMAYRVGKGVCFAISKRLLDEWNSDDLDRATSPEALSMIADDFQQAIQETKRYVQHLIKLKKLKILLDRSVN